MNNLPPPLSGTGYESQDFNDMRKSNRSLQPMESPGVLTTHSPSFGVMGMPIFGRARAGGGVSTPGLTLFAITNLGGGDTFTAAQVNAITMKAINPNDPKSALFPAVSLSGAGTTIVKWTEQRPSCWLKIPANFDGVQVTYQVAPLLQNPPDGYADNNRVAFAGAQTENQVCFPRYTMISTTGAKLQDPYGEYNWFDIYQSIIGAINIGITGSFKDANTDYGWLEIPQRVWAKRFT